MISMRVPREIYDRLIEIRDRTGQSWADIMKVGRGLQESILDVTAARDQLRHQRALGRRVEFNFAYDAFGIEIICGDCCSVDTVCTRRLQDAVGQLIEEDGWVHKDCSKAPLWPQVRSDWVETLHVLDANLGPI